jgi:hypothetical protein
MATPSQSATKLFEPNKKEVRYLAKRFPEFRQALIDFTKSYYPDSYSDFNEASPGMIFIEMASYIGDVLSFYIDNQFKENLLAYAEEEKNILTIAQSFGYKPRMIAPAVTDASIYQVVPALGVNDGYEPDPKYMLRILAGSTFSAQNAGNVTFRSLQDVNFSDPIDRSMTVINRDPLTGSPLVWLATKKIKLSSTSVKTITKSFGTPEKFSKIILDDDNVIGILDIKDSDGNTWYEVDYLAQDVIYKERDIADSTQTSVMGATSKTFSFSRTARRFVSRINRNFQYELQFGSGVNDVDQDIVTLDSRQLANDLYQQKIPNTSLDPVDFLKSSTYGLAPSNTTLTIRYYVGGGISSNVPSNTINTIGSLLVAQSVENYALNERAAFSGIVDSIAINNLEPARGGNDRETIEETRQNALAYFNAQNRVVTAEDYVVRTMAMPPRFGAVAKAYAISIDQVQQVTAITGSIGDRLYVDDVAIPNAVNLYVLGYDSRQKIATLNNTVKGNIAKYLESYRVLNDNVNVMDGFVINIGVNFSIKVYKQFNINDVLIRCMDAIKNHFDITKWQMNQPIYLNDLNLLINSVDGVRTVSNLEIVNKYKFVDGSDYNDYRYPIDEAILEDVLYTSADPSIFEIRYPERDIIGSASQ